MIIKNTQKFAIVLTIYFNDKYQILPWDDNTKKRAAVCRKNI